MGRVLHIDKHSLSKTAVYILTPCLLFSLIVESTVDPIHFAQMITYSLVTTLVAIAAALGVGRLLGWSARKVDGLVLATAFVNSGNLGLSVILFAYGEEGLGLGSAFFVVSNTVGTMLGAFFAARGDGSARRAAIRVLRLPALYAFLIAILLRIFGVLTPAVIAEPVALVGRAAVPLLLLILGLQLSQTEVSKQHKDISIGVVLRLVGGSISAIGLASLFGLEGLARKVGITEASMPTAVTSSLMAIEFGADPGYVTSVIFYSTLLSSLTLPVILALL